MELRDELIAEAVDAVGDLAPDELYELVLTPSDASFTEAGRVIESSIARGQRDVIKELRRQGLEIDPSTVEIAMAEVADTLTGLTISRVVNEMQARSTSAIVRNSMLGLSEKEIQRQLQGELQDQSVKWVEGYAASGVNAAWQEGRTETMHELDDQIRLYEYSAVLDANTCDPCGEWDGSQAEKLDDLPEVPNPACEGGDKCRCVIIALFE
jgi:Phage Mu protein F like protein